MPMTIDPRLHHIVAAQPYPLLFATVNGAHLLPLEKVVRHYNGYGKLRRSLKQHER